MTSEWYLYTVIFSGSASEKAEEGKSEGDVLAIIYFMAWTEGEAKWYSHSSNNCRQAYGMKLKAIND